jgi:Tfp pilus assembly protein PilF
MKSRMSFVVITLFFFGCASSINIPESRKKPVESSEAEKQKIEEAIELHDDGVYEEAIKLYEELLVSNPDNVLVLHEIAYSYHELGNAEKSLEYSLKGLEYDSDLIGPLSLVAGNNLDILGKPKEALKVYDNAIKYLPNENMLYYNIGITYIGLNESAKAETNLLKSLELDQAHSSSHIALAQVYMDKGAQIPSMLLLIRFLILEPTSGRSATALNYLNNVMSAGVEQVSDKTININVFSPSQEGFSQFSAIEMFHKMIRAKHYAEKDTNKSAFDYRLEEISSLLSFLKKEKLKEADTFLEKYLITYFSDLRDAGFSECSVYFIHQIVQDEEIQGWLRKNWPEVHKFKNWNEEYQLTILQPAK